MITSSSPSAGGKDSLACVLHLLDLGVPRERLELWHHDVDGAPDDAPDATPGLMDWPVTRDYCRKVAQALGVPLYFSWKEGGFAREMDRDGTATAPIHYEVPGGSVVTTGGMGPPGVRKKFPQVSPDLSVRWCSAYLKIDVGAAAVRGQARFQNARTLFVTGERAEESGARAKYKAFEPHRADLRHGRTPRHVDQWRPVHQWPESQVWEIIARHRINPHPAYRLGWGRVSCAACIFGSPNQWASLRAVNPGQFAAVASREAATGLTIQRKRSLPVLADAGTPYAALTPYLVALATGHEFTEPAILPEGAWTLPAGAYGESCGPT